MKEISIRWEGSWKKDDVVVSIMDFCVVFDMEIVNLAKNINIVWIWKLPSWV